MVSTIKSVNQLFEEAENVFQLKFGTKPNIKAFGPGRVNIIGEHTDYNDGFVFPLALPMGTAVVGSKNDLNECRVLTMSESVMESKFVTFPIPKCNEIQKSEVRWINYVIGVVAFFNAAKKECFDAIIHSSVPLGSGLSSSASLEVSVYVFLEELYQVKEKLSLTEKALLCQKVEHDYADVPCGIMDQFICAMGEKGHALLIDCRDLSSKLIKFQDDLISILIINSNVKHDLGSSEYPLRRKNCHLAASLLSKKSLRDASLQELEAVIDKMEPVIYMCARHVITENNRVLDAIEALRNSDFIKLGKLMNESHKSLRDDFKVSCHEIDQLVEIVQSCKGVLGSRMTGGGFGGCTVSLVYNSAMEKVISEVQKKFSGKPLFYTCTAENGARIYN